MDEVAGAIAVRPATEWFAQGRRWSWLPARVLAPEAGEGAV
jgi:hypothetical protein